MKRDNSFDFLQCFCSINPHFYSKLSLSSYSFFLWKRRKELWIEYACNKFRVWCLFYYHYHMCLFIMFTIFIIYVSFIYNQCYVDPDRRSTCINMVSIVVSNGRTDPASRVLAREIESWRLLIRVRVKCKEIDRDLDRYMPFHKMK